MRDKGERHTTEQAQGILKRIKKSSRNNARIIEVGDDYAGESDGRRKITHLFPRDISPEAVEKKNRGYRASAMTIEPLHAKIGHLTAKLVDCPPIGPTLKAMTAPGSAKEKSMVMRAAGAIMRGDIESMGSLSNLSGKAVRNYTKDVKRKVVALDQFLRDDAPSTLFAILGTICRPHKIPEKADMEIVNAVHRGAVRGFADNHEGNAAKWGHWGRISVFEGVSFVVKIIQFVGSLCPKCTWGMMSPIVGVSSPPSASDRLPRAPWCGAHLLLI